jgi:hypothetical protein
MFAIIYLLGTFIAGLLKSRRRLEVENLFLRHQLNIILRRPPQRLRLWGSDRVSLPQILSDWRVTANRAMLASDVGPLQTALAGACWPVSIESSA